MRDGIAATRTCWRRWNGSSMSLERLLKLADCDQLLSGCRQWLRDGVSRYLDCNLLGLLAPLIREQLKSANLELPD